MKRNNTMRYCIPHTQQSKLYINTSWEMKTKLHAIHPYTFISHSSLERLYNYTRIIKNIFLNERVCRDIYIKTEKAQEQDGFGNKMKYHIHITTIHKYRFIVFCLYCSCVYLRIYKYVDL